jgi:hypothetical protein
LYTRRRKDIFFAARFAQADLPMKQVFLIHAHKDLDQLNALAGQLADPDFIIYVNVDLKSAIDVAAISPQLRQVQRRIPIHWGDFSQVQATLNSLAQIVAEVPAFDKVVFVSAQDFPLLPNDQLKRALAAAAGSELLETTPVGPEGWACAHRYQYFHRPAGGALATLACKLGARAMRLAGLRRKMVRGLRPYGGSSWWALSRPCIETILATVAADPALVRFFRSVACPDELFFQTLVMNSAFAPRVVPDNFRYIQWPDSGARNPMILDAADFPRIAASGAHFCRKIDAAASAALVPLLERLKQQRAQAGNRPPL